MVFVAERKASRKKKPRKKKKRLNEQTCKGELKTFVLSTKFQLFFASDAKKAMNTYEGQSIQNKTPTTTKEEATKRER